MRKANFQQGRGRSYPWTAQEGWLVPATFPTTPRKPGTGVLGSGMPSHTGTSRTPRATNELYCLRRATPDCTPIAKKMFFSAVIRGTSPTLTQCAIAWHKSTGNSRGPHLVQLHHRLARRIEDEPLVDESCKLCQLSLQCCVSTF